MKQRINAFLDKYDYLSEPLLYAVVVIGGLIVLNWLCQQLTYLPPLPKV